MSSMIKTEAKSGRVLRTQFKDSGDFWIWEFMAYKCQSHFGVEIRLFGGDVGRNKVSLLVIAKRQVRDDDA